MARAGDGGWKSEAHGLVRAFSGAYLFGIPLLYTMEMWWIGTYAEQWKLVAFLALAFGINLYLAATAGFKEGRPPIRLGYLDQAADALAVGLVASLVVLVVLNRIGPDDPLDSILGMLIVQAAPLSIGASIANSILGANERGPAKGREGAPEEARRHGPWANLGIDLGATVAGGLFIGLSVAPTEEIPTLAAQMSPWHVLALMAFSLVVGYMIVFEAGFTRARPRPRTALIHHPSTATFVSYLVALGTAAVVLFLFDQLRAEDPVHVWLTQAVVLGLPGTIGGAAGRLVT